MRLFYFIFSLPFLFISCSSNVDIYFPSKFVSENEVVINDKLNLKSFLKPGEFSSVNVKNGEVSVSVNGKIYKFETSEGGLLNLDKSEFVIFHVYYEMGQNNLASSQGMPQPIMIDSIVYYNNKVFNMLSKETYIEFAEKNNKKKYDAEKEKDYEVTKINSSEFFIEKIWDININEEIPESVNVTTSSDVKSMNTGKRAIRSTDDFIKYAIASELFSTINLRNYKEN